MLAKMWALLEYLCNRGSPPRGGAKKGSGQLALRRRVDAPAPLHAVFFGLPPPFNERCHGQFVGLNRQYQWLIAQRVETRRRPWINPTKTPIEVTPLHWVCCFRWKLTKDSTSRAFVNPDVHYQALSPDATFSDSTSDVDFERRSNFRWELEISERVVRRRRAHLADKLPPDV